MQRNQQGSDWLAQHRMAAHLDPEQFQEDKTLASRARLTLSDEQPGGARFLLFHSAKGGHTTSRDASKLGMRSRRCYPVDVARRADRQPGAHWRANLANWSNPQREPLLDPLAWADVATPTPRSNSLNW